MALDHITACHLLQHKLIRNIQGEEKLTAFGLIRSSAFKKFFAES